MRSRAVWVVIVAPTLVWGAWSMNGCATAVVDVPDGSSPVTCKADAGGMGENCACTEGAGWPKPCYEADPKTLKGACKSGKRSCTGGVQGKCDGQIIPTMEICNGIDDDCNGVVDDMSSTDPDIGSLDDAGFEGGIQCFVNGQTGLCAAGRYGCDTMGKKGCVPILSQDDAGGGVQMEACNGFDDDCNGSIDDVSWQGEVCSIDNKLGECGKGMHACMNAMETCTTSYTAKAEICNGKDDNCNGQTDEGAKCPSPQICVSGMCTFFCPHVFAWNGKSFSYETTVGGVSLIGRKEHVTKGRDLEFAPMWARLDTAAIERDASGLGVVRSKIVAAEDEIVYLDEAKLAVVEHPAGTEVLTSSSIDYKALGTKDPQTFWAMRSAGLRTPTRASWMARVDVTNALATKDDRAAAYDPKQDNFYELDFGAVKDASHAWLVVDGWKYKELRRLPEATPREKPRLEVLGADGVWHKALALATPRGDKKAVVFDLSTVKWPEGRYHARLYTGTHEGGNAMWYLDRVRLTEEAPIVPAVDTLAARSADLQFVGAPSVEDEGNHAHALLSVDDGKGTLRSEQRTWGRFTRYGDVRELLGSGDDRMVVMRRGDGVELRFEGVRAPRAGALVTVMLETDLVFKPRTWLGEKRGTVVSERVEPMPYHGMSHYPPAKPFPDDEAHRAYMREWQTRSYEPGDTRWGP